MSDSNTMNTMRLHKILTLAAGCGLLLASCDDFLETEPKDRLLNEFFYTNTDECDAAVQSLYTRPWYDFNDKFYFAMGDGRGGNLLAPYSDYIYPFADFQENGLTGPLMKAWTSFYIIFSQSSRIIQGIGGSSLDADNQARYIGEARFMRGVVAYYLAALWPAAVLYEDPSALVDNPTRAPAPRKDVIEFAIRDMEYAALHLPAEAPDGRVNKYSAYGMLSRFYLFDAFLSDDPNSGAADQAKLDLAKKAAQKVITESKFKLMDNYADVFEIEHNNNSEQMFSLQWIPGVTTWGLGNSQQAYLAYGSDVTGDDASWGSYTYAYPECITEFLLEDGKVRRPATWMVQGDYYATIDRAHGGLTADNGGNSRFNGKKGVTGSAKDNPAIARMNSGLNTNMLRLPEVYINYAEAALGAADECSDQTAIDYLNVVRKRAKVPAITGKFTWQDIRHENRMEFTLEGKYWYDLARRALYKQQEVVNYLTQQDRGNIVPYEWDKTAQTWTVNEDVNPTKRAIKEPGPDVFLLPFPETELIQNPLLGATPVPYSFGEERLTNQLF